MRWGPMRNPVRGFMDLSAAVASVIGLSTLVVLTVNDVPRLVSMVVFGLSLVAVYTTSTLYHCVPWSPTWRQRMQRLDHSMIFLLVAGSYTPIAFNVLSGRWRWFVLAVVWSLAAFGIVLKFGFTKVRTWLSVTIQTTMGWFAVIPLVELVRRLSDGAILLMFLSGLLYTVGLVLFSVRRPRLFPRFFSYHEVFHVFVISASAAHFAMILLYVVPYPRA